MKAEVTFLDMSADPIVKISVNVLVPRHVPPRRSGVESLCYVKRMILDDFFVAKSEDRQHP